MQETGKRDDKLYMIPVDMNAGGMMSYTAKLFEQVEPLQPPETYDEILDMIQAWNDGLGDEYPDLLPMRSDDYRKRMVTLAISMYADAAAARHQEFSYHDPALQKMLARALSVQTDNIAQRIDWQSPDAQAQSDLLYSKAALIEDYYYLSLEDLNINLRAEAQGISLLAQSGNTEYETGAQLPLRLALHKGEEPAVGIGLTLMAVNPRSRNHASAIAYIEEYVKHIDPGKQAMMNPGLNDHIPNPRYEEEAEALEATRL
jgi:ABC-type glycerol-3-phosphate transport system substrate-binding protein